MSLKLQPVGDRVVVERIDLESTIIIPEFSLERQNDHREGRVLAVGTGRLYRKPSRRIAPDISVGDRVVFSKWAGSPMKIEGRDVIVMQVRDVMAVVDQDDVYETVIYPMSTAKTPEHKAAQDRALARASRRSA